MRTEFETNKALTIQAEIQKLEKEIRNAVGFVPSEAYDRLDELQMKLLKVK